MASRSQPMKDLMPGPMERLQMETIVRALRRDRKVSAYWRMRKGGRPAGADWGDWLLGRRARILVRRRAG